MKNEITKDEKKLLSLMELASKVVLLEDKKLMEELAKY